MAFILSDTDVLSSLQMPLLLKVLAQSALFADCPLSSLASCLVFWFIHSSSSRIRGLSFLSSDSPKMVLFYRDLVPDVGSYLPP